MRILLLRLILSWWMIPFTWLFLLPFMWLLHGSFDECVEAAIEMSHILWTGEME